MPRTHETTSARETKSVAWITGGGTGIGEACAKALARAGFHVVLSGRRDAELRRVRDHILANGGAAEVLALDVSDANAVDTAASAIRDRHGRIDLLVHAAGMNIHKRAWRDVTPDDFDALTRVNLNGAFYCCRAVLPIMREQHGGLIIAISSWAGRHPSAVAGAAYSASKHAMNALTETINIEEGRKGIRATALCPGEVATDILDKRPQPPSAEDRARMLQPEDIAAIVMFIATLAPHVCINDLLVSPTWNRLYN